VGLRDQNSVFGFSGAYLTEKFPSKKKVSWLFCWVDTMLLTLSMKGYLSQGHLRGLWSKFPKSRLLYYWITVLVVQILRESEIGENGTCCKMVGWSLLFLKNDTCPWTFHSGHPNPAVSHFHYFLVLEFCLHFLTKVSSIMICRSFVSNVMFLYCVGL
jgi:hypothetical protein